jgi:hypothetical protein
LCHSLIVRVSSHADPFYFVLSFPSSQGCDHDRGGSSRCDSTRSNFGYREPTGLFRDIMSTECQTNQCDNNPASSCIRIQRYSNMQSYNGRLIGDKKNNCAGHISSVVAIAASIRTSIYMDSQGSYSEPITHVPTKAPIPQNIQRPTPSPTRPPPTRSPTPPPTVDLCGNGICDRGEDCNTCPIDCARGSIQRAFCGNGICEAGDGETYYSCPYDCRGDAIGSLLCGLYATCAPACNTGDFSCTNIPRGSDYSCCGDGLCTAGENELTCNVDC